VVTTAESGSGGRPRLKWRLLTHPHLALDERRLPPRPLRYSHFPLRMTDAPLCVQGKKVATFRGKRAPSDQLRGRDADGQTQPPV